MKAVVTGADGFIGRLLCRRLRDRGWEVRGLTRSDAPGAVAVGDLALTPASELTRRLEGADLVFNLAGRAHRTDAGRDSRLADLYRRDNIVAAERVYGAAVDARVGRFVQVSTIKVLGDVSASPLSTTAPGAPPDVYSATKWEAERRLEALSSTGIPTTVVRLPLVYGPGVSGNFARLIDLVGSGWPMPLGAARAERSLLDADSLCALLERLAGDDASFRVVHARGHDVSVARLVELIAQALDCRARLIPIPKRVMAMAFRAAGAASTFRSLFEPLRVDDSDTRSVFHWSPSVDLPAAVAAAVAARKGS